MSDWQGRLRDLQEELRQSPNPVSVFFLLSSPRKVEPMVQRLGALRSFGTTQSQIVDIANAVTEALEQQPLTPEFRKQCEMSFEVDGELRKGGFCYIRNIPGAGLEVEVTLPGIIASLAVGFIDNTSGFWTAFMPPSFYR